MPCGWGGGAQPVQQEQPSKIAQLFGGQLAAQLVVALALGAALHAFGAHLSLTALLIAVTTAGVLASASCRLVHPHVDAQREYL